MAAAAWRLARASWMCREAGIREEIERESEVGVIDRGGPCHILNGRGKGHGVLFPDEFFCQFPEFFLTRRRRFGFHRFVAPSFEFVDSVTNSILAQSFRKFNPLSAFEQEFSRSRT